MDNGDTVVKIESESGVVETCKWDDNAACTWNGFLDCQDNCVCMEGDGNNDPESCRTPITYGEPYYLQVVTGSGSIRRWLTNSRDKKTSGGSPKSGTGDRVWTQDGAHTGGCKGCPTIDDQYRWAIRSTPGNGKTIDEETGLPDESNRDRMSSKCIKYGDEVYLQGLGVENHWLTGGRNSNGELVRMQNINTAGPSNTQKFMVRSASAANGSRTAEDKRKGQCVRRKDQVIFQVMNRDNRYLTGARDKGNYNVYTRSSLSRFEIRSAPQENGQTTSEPAQPRTLIPEL